MRLKGENPEGRPNDCPMCRRPVTMKQMLEIPDAMLEAELKGEQKDFNTRDGNDDGVAWAQKAAEMIRVLRLYPNTKSLVFSQWTTHLRYLADCLDDEGIEWIQFDGTLNLEERDSVIEAFKAPGGPPVLLLSLACGSLGLNLTCATNVFLMDPWVSLSARTTRQRLLPIKWQSQIEQQAVDRAYRIGQTQPVRVFQIVAENTGLSFRIHGRIATQRSSQSKTESWQSSSARRR
jgi:SWI/SNF-related matrix-associated actin-dependent regulator of chromatin subfamily A3